MADRVPTKYDYRDLIDTPVAFTGLEITDAGTDEFFIPGEILIFESGFTLNTQEDGLGLNITGFDFIDLNDFLTGKLGENVYEKIQVTDPTYQTGTIYAFGDIAGSDIKSTDPNRLQDQIDQINQGTNHDDIGTIKTFATYKDRPSLLPFAFDNAVSQATYSVLYVEIGDIFETSHTDAGDAASGAGLFYPTPVPGSYPRSGIPDISFTDADVANDSGIVITHDIEALRGTNAGRRGTAFKFEVLSGTPPTGLVDGTTYYVLPFSSSLIFRMYTSEADAISDSSAIAYTDTGSGTFRLTQEGISIGDAVEEHGHEQLMVNAGGGATIMVERNVAGSSETSQSNTAIGDILNAKVSNETRPATYYEFAYIKAESITPSGEPVSALRYVQDWSLCTAWTAGNSITIPHPFHVVFDEYKGQIFVRDPAVPGKIYNALDFQYIDSGSTTFLGQLLNGINNDLDNCYLQLGNFASTPGRYSADSGVAGAVLLTWEYKIILEKPNLVTTYFEPTIQTYNITDAVDVTVVVPDAASNVAERTYIRKGAGAGKLILSSGGGDFDYGDDTDITVELEGIGTVVIQPSGGLQEVKAYEDTITDGVETYIKEANGELKYYTWGSILGDASDTISDTGSISRFISITNIKGGSNGGKTGGAPTNLIDFSILTTDVQSSLISTLILWSIQLYRAATTFSNTAYYGYSVELLGRWRT